MTTSERELVSSKAKLAFRASLEDSSAIYSYDLLDRDVERILREECARSGIRTKLYPRDELSGMGAGPGQALAAVFQFYQDHRLLFEALATIPGLIALGKWVVGRLASLIQYLHFFKWRVLARIKSHKPDYLPRLAVYVRAEVKTSQDEDGFLKMELVKRCAIELVNLTPRLETAIRKKHPELQIVFHMTAKAIDSGYGINVNRISSDSRVLALSISKVGKIREGVMTHTVYIERTALLHRLVARVHKNSVVY